MRNHVRVDRDLPCLEGPVEDAVVYIRNQAEGLIDPEIVVERYYDNGDELRIEGWRPMTEKELATAKKKRLKDREAKARAKIRNDEIAMANLEKQAKKLGKKLVDE